MKKFCFFAVVVLMSSYFCVFAQETEKKRQKFDPTRDPFADLKNAVEYAQIENKRILLDVGGEWCIWCHRLDNFIETNEELKNYLLNNYLVVKVNFSPENKNEKFLSQFPKISGYPHFFVLENDGNLLHSQETGLLEKEKSYSADLLLEFFKKWAPVK